MKRFTLAVLTTVSMLTIPAVASAHINLKRAAALDRRAEASMLVVPLNHVDVFCAVGPRGNVGCDYDVLFTDKAEPSTSAGEGIGITITLDLAGWWHGHDAVVRRHGRLRVLSGTWMHSGYRT